MACSSGEDESEARRGLHVWFLTLCADRLRDEGPLLTRAQHGKEVCF